MKRSIHFVEITTQNFLPLTWGLLRSFADADPSLKESYSWREPLIQSRDKEQFVDDMEDPYICAASISIWNERVSLWVLSEAKKRHPNCRVVVGGYHLPGDLEALQGYLREHPYIDVVVHYEGETTFRRLLDQYRRPEPNLTDVQSITFRKADGTLVRTGPLDSELPKRISNADLPSPYLLGYFEPIVQRFRANQQPLNALLETNRGCPYACTFCEWGVSALSKMRHFEEERVHQEFEYLAEIGITGLYLCDANFGTYERDLRFARHIADLKKKTGYPRLFHTNWAKAKPDRVFETAAQLAQADLLSAGITLAAQSMSQESLTAIKRKNNDFELIQARCDEMGLPTYAELMIPLPLETRQSWIDGICALMESGIHENICCYESVLLPNSEMGSKEARERFGLRTVRRAMNGYLRNSRGAVEMKREPLPTLAEIVIETNTMGQREVAEGMAFYESCVIGLHCGAHTRFVSQFLRREGLMDYQTFYQGLFDRGLKEDSVLGKVIQRLVDLRLALASDESISVYEILFSQEDLLEDLAPYQGKNGTKRSWYGWDWAWLVLNKHMDQFYQELSQFLEKLRTREVESGFLVGELQADLVRYQKEIMVTPAYDPERGKECTYDFNWPAYFFAGEPLRKTPVKARYSDTHMGTMNRPLEANDLAAFCSAAMGDFYPEGRQLKYFHQPHKSTVTFCETNEERTLPRRPPKVQNKPMEGRGSSAVRRLPQLRTV